MDDFLQIRFLTTNGRVWSYHRDRRFDPWWGNVGRGTPFFESPFATANFTRIAIAAQPNIDSPFRSGKGVHSVGITSGGQMLYEFVVYRVGSDGNVDPRVITDLRFENLMDNLFPLSTIINAAIAVVGYADAHPSTGTPLLRSVPHVCAVTIEGSLLYTVRRENGQWTPPVDLGATRFARGGFVAVALGGAVGPMNWGELHLCAVTADRKLWHAIRRSTQQGPADIQFAADPTSGVWTGLGDVEEQVGDVGSVVGTACARSGNVLRVCAVTDDGRLWKTTRFGHGGWAPASDVEFLEFKGGRVGRDVGEVVTVALGPGSAGINDLCAATSDGRLWYATIDASGLASRLIDVETEMIGIGNVGSIGGVGIC